MLYSCNEIKDFAALHKVTRKSESAFARFSEKRRRQGALPPSINGKRAAPKPEVRRLKRAARAQ
ncbi:MAG: hypothetical protein ACK5UX_08485 [Burkholderiales bacterium]